MNEPEEIKVPNCICFHPLDAHDYKTGECLLFGCACVRYEESHRQ